MDAHVPKPIDPSQLYEVLARFSSTAPRRTRIAKPVAVPVSLSDSEVEEIIDIDRVRQMPGGERAIRELGQLLHDEAPRLFKEILKAIDKGDADQLLHASHTLKGSANVFANTTVVTVAERLESLAMDEQLDSPELATVVEQLRLEVQQLTAALSDLLESVEYRE